MLRCASFRFAATCEKAGLASRKSRALTLELFIAPYNDFIERKVMSFEPKILGIACNWCTYTGADLAGTTRLQYPPNVRVVRVMCSSRINPSFIFRALQFGADGVLVGGCHPGDCHYNTGNLYARRRLATTKKILEFAGIEQGRFRVEWISASEGNRFAEVIEEFTTQIKNLGPQTKLKIQE
jgi:F420-non-reducing hydrogenase iron-sulfur subunit